MKAYGENRGTGPLIHNLGYRWKWAVKQAACGK
jgi:hypothetical protein